MTRGQRHLTEVYEQVKDLLEETPPEVWDAYCRCGRKYAKTFQP